MERQEKENVENLIERQFRSIKLETSIIAYCLRKDWRASEQLKEEYFTVQPFRKFVDIVKEKRMEFPKDIFYGEIKNKKELKQELEIYKSYIIKVYEIDLKSITTKNISALIKKLREKCDSRKLFNLIDECLDNVETFNLEETSKKFNYFFMERRSHLSGEEGEYLEGYEKRKEYMKELKKNKSRIIIPTCFEEFNKLGGGIYKGEMASIMRKTGGGKSIALMNNGIHAWQLNYNVVYINLEMTKMQSEIRMDSNLSDIEHQKFRKGELGIFEYEKWEKKIKQLREERQNYFITISLPRGCTANDIETALMRIQDEKKQSVDLLLVDYLNLMTQNKISKESSKAWENQVEIAWELKGMTMDWDDKKGLALITCNQLTDEGSKVKKLEAYHLKYSRGISEVFPILLGITDIDGTGLDSLLGLWIVKCRDVEIPKKSIILHPNFSYMRIDDKGKRFKEEEE